MSNYRRARVRISVKVSDDIDVGYKKLPAFLDEDTFKEKLKVSMIEDGFEEDKGKLVKKEGNVKITYMPEENKIKIEIEKGMLVDEDRKDEGKEKVKSEASNVLKLYLEEYGEKVRKKYIPQAIEKALIEKVKMMDPSAKFEKTENEDEVILKVSFER